MWPVRAVDAAGDPEHEWGARIRDGDIVAFESVFRTYHPQLCAFLYRYVRSKEIAEELVQDVFARLWEQRAVWPIRTSPRRYLYTAARNHAISWLRHTATERKLRDERPLELASERVPQGENGIERRVQADELARAIQQVIAHLPARCRVALTLRWHHELSYADIADVMGISIKTVEIYVTRGMKALRERYEMLLPHR